MRDRKRDGRGGKVEIGLNILFDIQQIMQWNSE